MTWARLLLAAILVMSSVSIAAAEGVWVVWKRTVGTDSETWSMQEAYLSRSRCQGFGITTALTQDVRSARNHPDYQDFEPGGDGMSYRFTKTKPDGSGAEPVHVRFVCLPDTLDPREKKE